MPDRTETQFHGVISIGSEASFTLKHQALLFDRLVIASPTEPLPLDWFVLPAHVKADVEFLKSKGLLLDSRDLSLPRFSTADHMDVEQVHRAFTAVYEASKQPKNYLKESVAHKLDADLRVRSVSAKINAQKLFKSVPIYRTEMPTILAQGTPESPNDIATVLSVAFEELPMPGMESSWEDILAFREEMKDKKWTFRRFLKDLATKKQAQAEIRDDIEWTLNQYREAMEVHRLKSAHSFVDVFLIAPLGILEDIVKFKWSKLAKSALSVRTRKIDLREAQSHAPGNECAYVFDALKRFAKHKPKP
jgi:hypothetical protein